MSGALLFTHPLYCQDVTFFRYEVDVPPALRTDGQPLRLQITSQYAIPVESQRQLLVQYRVAAATALAFAKENALRLQRSDLPTRIVLCNSPQALADFTGMPSGQYGGLVVARIDLSLGIVYLGRRDPSDLYVELGKWFFYDRQLRWGENRGEDLKRLDMAERFARDCQRKDFILARQ